MPVSRSQKQLDRARRRPALIRDPADWATENGWVSRRRAKNLAGRIEAVAVEIAGASGDVTWARELRAIAKAIAPAKTVAERARRI